MTKLLNMPCPSSVFSWSCQFLRCAATLRLQVLDAQIVVLLSPRCAGRELNFFAAFDMSHFKDPSTFSFVPVFAFANYVMDVPCYLINISIWALTKVGDRTTVGKSRGYGGVPVV